MTDPLDAITLPYLVKHTIVFLQFREAAIATFSEYDAINRHLQNINIL